MNREHENDLSPRDAELESAIEVLVAKHGKLMVITVVNKLDKDSYKIRALSILSKAGMTLKELLGLTSIL